MVPHNFNSETNRGVTCNCPPGPGEYTVMLTLKQSRGFIDHPTRYMWNGTELVEWTGWEQEEAERIALGTVARQELEIRARYAAMLVSITEPYGGAERETWKTQEEEAHLWTPESDGRSGETDLCPMIRAMATTRGIPMSLMVAKILSNAALFRQASGQILGMQQAELDILYPERKEEV